MRLRQFNTNEERLDNVQKKLNFIFAAFPHEIISRPTNIQFHTLKLVNVNPENVDKQQEVIHMANTKLKLETTFLQLKLNNSPQEMYLLKASMEKNKIGNLCQRTGNFTHRY